MTTYEGVFEETPADKRRGSQKKKEETPSEEKELKKFYIGTVEQQLQDI